MDLQQFQALTALSPPRRALMGKDLADRTPRTLIRGYTAERYHFHAYLDEAGVIHRVVYSDYDELLLHATEDRIESNDQYAPTKRVYPDASDFEFCAKLLAAGVPLAFHIYDTKRPLRDACQGKRVEQLTSSRSASLRRLV